MPSASGKFQTLKRERLFRNPPKDKSAFPALEAAVRPHVDSFNALTVDGGLLDLAARDIGERAVFDGSNEWSQYGNKLTIRVEKIYVDKPKLSIKDKTSLNRLIYPSECRERHISYRSRLTVKLGLKVNNGEWQSIDRECGQIPVMLRTNRCNLEKLSPAELVNRKEETEELGGYFIVNGNEKLIRLLVVQRRNHPMAIIRPSYSNRGASYTNFGVQIRCARPDQTSQTNVLHYLSDGNVTFRFSWRKNEYLIPAMMVMKALVETNDREIFDGLVSVEQRDNTFLTDRVELLLRTYKVYGLPTRLETLAYLGDKFRVVMGLGPDLSDVDVGKEVLRRIVLVHLNDDRDKFRMLLFMAKKLYALVKGDCAQDNPDAIQHQEILLGGFLYGMVLKERVEKLVDDIRAQIRADAASHVSVDFRNKAYLSRVFLKVNENLGGALEYFLSTGNLSSPSGLDLQQVSGFTVVAEKINFYRFISHFRMVHRGAFFAQLKTTTVRKLLPESWGFLCPVHTPDGSPCGLLNHLAHKCMITTTASNTSSVRKVLTSLGISSPATSPLPRAATMCVQLDGCILGWCSPREAKVIADTLRYWKVEASHDLPLDLEIGYVPESNGGQYPGVYLFSQQARMIRPVKYLPLDKEDIVGPFEQPHMSIAVNPQEIISGESTHVEFDPTNILSIVANMTPFSDFNQSPRNMYQCQMGKQAMGTPGTATRYRTDNKSYRLQTGQTPIVKAPLYDEYGLDNFPNGMNAVVAVISYTGYDMDDAMILNKSSYERGFGYGTVYKTEQYGWREKGRGEKTGQMLFGFAEPESIAQILSDYESGTPVAPSPVYKPDAEAPQAEWEEYETKKEGYDKAKLAYDSEVRKLEKSTKDRLNSLGKVQFRWFKHLDLDGFPIVGQRVEDGDPVAAYYDVSKKEAKVFIYHGSEVAFIDEVRLLAHETPDQPCQEISIKFRIPRSPQIGDKFASRHGQKGVCSQKWPAADMPFTESGMQPDVIINPHAFPSRMTIGMLVESLAGKSGALHGVTQDCTPFRFDEENTAADYFGHQLIKAGYNYHGNEPMYSGITGEELKADIYIGLVYYQRLRHMVNDKFQVRTTGKISELTHQPIKGRKKGGGIRVGEMERDSMLAHGAAFLLQDRLLNCSDYTQAWICRTCGTFMSITPTIKKPGFKPQVRCRRCATKATGFESEGEVWEDGHGNVFVGGENTTVVAIPYVLKYLDAELSAMGVQMKYNVKH
ncbi:DNA-directed RNA polymerase I subunit RPA2 [Tirmania nivea]|nr:DNA-directed RNA polymerase I subunit RPA2 [Tirmania nivea]